jgi:hypothetical protein
MEATARRIGSTAMKLRQIVVAGALASARVVSGAAQAATLNFDYSGLDGANLITVVGTVATDSITPSISYSDASGTSPNLFGYDIISIAGTRTESGVTQQISGLIGAAGTIQWVAPSTSPVSLQPGWYYDNIVYGSNAPSGVDLRGVEYSAIADGVTSLYDVWFQSGTYYENYTPLTSGSVGSISPVSLPPALPLFGAAIIGVGLLGWRKQRQTNEV